MLGYVLVHYNVKRPGAVHAAQRTRRGHDTAGSWLVIIMQGTRRRRRRPGRRRVPPCDCAFTKRQSCVVVAGAMHSSRHPCRLRLRVTARVSLAVSYGTVRTVPHSTGCRILRILGYRSSREDRESTLPRKPPTSHGACSRVAWG